MHQIDDTEKIIVLKLYSLLLKNKLTKQKRLQEIQHYFSHWMLNKLLCLFAVLNVKQN